jgi:hypothetical protein
MAVLKLGRSGLAALVPARLRCRAAMSFGGVLLIDLARGRYPGSTEVQRRLPVRAIPALSR